MRSRSKADGDGGMDAVNNDNIQRWRRQGNRAWYAPRIVNRHSQYGKVEGGDAFPSPEISPDRTHVSLSVVSHRCTWARLLNHPLQIHPNHLYFCASLACMSRTRTTTTRTAKLLKIPTKRVLTKAAVVRFTCFPF